MCHFGFVQCFVGADDRGARGPLGGVRSRVGDGERRMIRQIPHQVEIVIGVGALGVASQERCHADDLRAADHRNCDHTPYLETLEDLAVLR